MADELLNYLNSSPFYAGLGDEDEKNRTEFLNNFAALPKILKDFLASTQTADYISNLGQQYQLDERQVVLLAIIIRYIVLGEIYIKDSVSMIVKFLGVDSNTASLLFNQVVKELFSPVIEEIKKIQRLKFSDRIASEHQAQSINQGQPVQSPSLHEQNMGNVVDLRNKK